MSLLANMTTDDTINDDKDFVGGGGPLETALYPMEVDMAYVEKKASGALFVNLTLKSDDGRTYKESLCIASGDAKGNKNYYEKDGQKNYLPGFNHINNLCLLTVGKNLAELSEPETKAVNVYNFELKKDVLTQVPVIVDLLGQRAIFGIEKQIVDKQAKDDSGKYVNTGDTRETNEIDKIFRERDRMTTAEIRAEATEAAFYATWDQKKTGKTRNKASAANDATGGTAGASKAAGSTKPQKSLFAS